MFQSEPICILTAGPTIDGRHIEQQVIDDIAELYDPKTYNARINEDHWRWGEKFGSVLSVEKRDSELWAVLKPNSKLLGAVERGQLLHTSCEIRADYASTGKSYLTGLALTDEPASLGTTEMHLSADKADGNSTFFSTGGTVSMTMLSGKECNEQEERTLLGKLVDLLTGNQTMSISKQDDEEKEDLEVSKELKELLAKNAEQNEAVVIVLGSLASAVEKLSANNVEVTPPADVTTPPEVILPETNAELSAKVDNLSTQVQDLVTKFSSVTDEEQRKLAGEGGETPWLS